MIQRQPKNVVSTIDGIDVLRTPDERFTNLPDYPFEPNYIDIAGLRVHYLDEGPKDGAVVLMLHGEPSWSYLYRKMVPRFAAAGYRALAPDLPGFGKSDKFAEGSAYSYEKYVSWMWQWLESLQLTEITLFCQDWGSLIGLRLVAEHPDRFSRVVLANGGLPTGDRAAPAAFKAWQTFAAKSPVFPIGKIIQRATKTSLSKEIIAAYDAPFPGKAYQAAARIFPSLVPTTPDDPAAPANRAAWEALKQFNKPFLTAFSDADPITRGGERPFKKLVPGAQGQPHTTIQGAGHFCQEDKGAEYAELTIAFMKGS